MGVRACEHVPEAASARKGVQAGQIATVSKLRKRMIPSNFLISKITFRVSANEASRRMDEDARKCASTSSR